MDELDLVSLLLVVGSAVAVVVLGMLIYYGEPLSKKSAVPQHVPFAPAASPPISLVSTVKTDRRKEKGSSAAAADLSPGPCRAAGRGFGAPPPFSEDPMCTAKKENCKIGLAHRHYGPKGFL